MNPPKVNEYDYINFLIATHKAYSCVEAERVQPKREDSPAHDAITRLLHRMEPSAEALWSEAQQHVNKTAEQFKRRFGVQRETFKQMVKALQPEWRTAPKPGAQPKLALDARILVALKYWREYRPDFHIGTSWCISESTVYRIIQ